ncbi:MAG: hypothetical protein ACR2JQ_06785, partial [Mycobacteriales bacterium]
MPTVTSRLQSVGRSWKAYQQDMGNVPARESATCAHPLLNSRDTTQQAVPGDGYVTRHDPFVYFHNVIDHAYLYSLRVVPLGTPSGQMPAGTPAGVRGLAGDLRSVATTPAHSFITDVCSDGHDYPCVNRSGRGSALADIDAFLASWTAGTTSPGGSMTTPRSSRRSNGGGDSRRSRPATGTPATSPRCSTSAPKTSPRRRGRSRS